MKLLIEIPEEQYRTLNAKSQNDVVAVVDDALLIKAIKNGKLLDEMLDAIKAETTDKSYLSYDDNPRHIIDESWVLEIIDKYRGNMTRDEKMIDDIDFAIKATNSQDDYSIGMRNGMRYVKYLINGKEPQYELRRTEEEIKLGINLGDEVVSDYGAKGVVVGMDTHKEAGVMLSLLMGNHKVPQLVQASGYKTKTGRHFPQIVEVLEQMKGEADGK